MTRAWVALYSVKSKTWRPAKRSSTSETILAIFVSIFTSAVQVAGPVVLAMVLTDAAFGLVSRVVPQLNVFGVGFSAKVAVGLLLIMASLPFLAGWLADSVQGSVADAMHVIRAA